MNRPSPGRWLQYIGATHLTLGLLSYRGPLGEIARPGVFRAVPDRGDHATAFWFLMAGPALWTSGRLLRAAEEADGRTAQRVAGGVLAGTGAFGAAVIPASGFWALAAVGVAAYRRVTSGRGANLTGSGGATDS